MKLIKLSSILLIIGAVALGAITASKNATPPVAYEITIDGKKYISDIFIISDKSAIFTDLHGRQIEVSVDRVQNVKGIKKGD